MTKTLIDVDNDLLLKAQQILGTETKKDLNECVKWWELGLVGRV
jgi:Arc/MetJ family transcription regulator